LRARTRPTLRLAALAALAAPLLARPHDIPRENVVNAFVKVEPGRVHLVVRVPTLLLASMRFPAAATRELDLGLAGPAVERAVTAVGREIVLAAGGRPLAPEPLAARLSLPSDRSFESWDAAVAHLRAALAPGTVIYADQGFFDAHYAYAVPEGAALSVETRLVRALREHLVLSLRYLPEGGAERAYRITSLDGAVALDPSWHEAAWSFVSAGERHILDGIDHLLFLLLVVLPLRRPRALLAVVTSFTAAHSVTLVAAAYGLAPTGAWFAPLVEVLIAASIVYMAIENVLVPAPRARWIATGAFGLVHGFGFAAALARDLQFAGDHLLVSLLAFNLGVEAGQLLVLAAVVPALWLLSRVALLARYGTAIASVFVGHTAWHWLAERFDALGVATGGGVERGTALAGAAAVLLAAAVAIVLARRRGRATAAPEAGRASVAG